MCGKHKKSNKEIIQEALNATAEGLDTFAVKISLRGVLNYLEESIKATPKEQSQRKEHNRLLDAFLHALLEVVGKANGISFEASRLAVMHVLRALAPQSNIPIPAMDQSFFNRCLTLVGGNVEPQSKYAQLETTFRDHYLPCRGDHVGESGAGISEVFSDLAKDMATSFKNHVTANLEKWMRKYLDWQMPRQDSTKLRKKMTNHAYKIWAGLKTFWPPSVARTPARVAAVTAAVQHFHTLFPRPRGVSITEKYISAHAASFLPIMYSILRYIEQLQGNNAESRDPGPQEYLNKSWVERKLKKHAAAEWPLMSTSRRKKLSSFMTKAIMEKRVVSTAALARFELSPASATNIVNTVAKTIRKMNAGVFQPKKYRGGKKGATLFALVPVFKYTRRHIPFSKRSFHHLLSVCKFPGLPSRKAFDNRDIAKEWMWKVFSLQRIKINTPADMDRPTRVLNCTFETDGYAISFHFCRKKLPDAPLLGEEGYQRPPAFTPLPGDHVWAADPGVTDLFVAVDGCGGASGREPHSIVSMSSKEYHFLASHRRNEQLRIKWKREEHLRARGHPGQKSILEIETALPTANTTSLQAFKRHLTYVLQHLGVLVSFYDRKFNKLNFTAFQGRQRALDEAIRRFTGGSRKYHDGGRQADPATRALRKQKRDAKKQAHPRHPPDRPPRPPDLNRWTAKPVTADPPGTRVVIAFGNGKFPTTMKGKLPCAVRRVVKHARHVARRLGPDKLAVVMVDEYLTSQVCTRCHQRSLESHNGLHDVRICEKCGANGEKDLLWNRDVNGARGIYRIFQCERTGQPRPREYLRTAEDADPVLLDEITDDDDADMETV
jgi:hypothetical protein